MNTKTFLSSHFPNFVQKWKKFYNKFKHVDTWYIVSDYCFDDKDKPNDVVTFTLLPFGNPFTVKEQIKQHLGKDLKHCRDISEGAIKYIKESPYFFSIACIIKDKNKIFNLASTKILLDSTIKKMENWPEAKREEFIHQFKALREYLKRKDVHTNILSNMCVTVHILCVIIEFLLIKTRTNHIFWISDRDKITDFKNGVIHKLVRLGYANLLKKRISDHQVYGVLDDGEYHKEIYDELVRIPDYISGAIAGIDFDDIDKTAEKDYTLFNDSIVDNERIYIMDLEHNLASDMLSELHITRRQ